MSRLPPAAVPWNPTRIVRVRESYDTSMGTTRVQTDASLGYLKAMGNDQGPHCLASELIATALADWFGLHVAGYAIFELPAEACFELPSGAKTQPGPAFVSRHVPGRTWAGSVADLHGLVNPDDITRLVVFDTWVRNCDRHPPDPAARKPNYANVYLADTDDVARQRLLAIDHTHCFDCGRDLSPALRNIDAVRDERTYGLFPEFVGMISPGALAWCRATLLSLSADTARDIVRRIPAAWDVSAVARTALADFITIRAAYLTKRIEAGWTPSPAGTVAP